MAENNTTLASELLYELQKSTKRWFMAFIVVLVLWFATIGLGIWYMTIPIEESYTVDQDATNDSYNQFIGGDEIGSPSKSDLQ